MFHRKHHGAAPTSRPTTSPDQVAAFDEARPAPAAELTAAHAAALAAAPAEAPPSPAAAPGALAAAPAAVPAAPTVEPVELAKGPFGLSPTPAEPTPQGPADLCPQGGVKLFQIEGEILEDESQDLEAGNHSLPPLGEKPWCNGTMPDRWLSRKVALVLVGQPFRAKNFRNHSHKTCSMGTLQSQRDVAESHHMNIIWPLEGMGFKVDVFLTDAPCEMEVVRKGYEEYRAGFPTEKYLRDMYLSKRVRRVVRPDPAQNMYSKFAEAFDSVDQEMKKLGGLYEYFIILRYDVAVDRSFITQMPQPPSQVHHGMSFYQKAHDFMWSFPGELWSCFHQWWKGCLVNVGPHGLGTIGLKLRRNFGCFNFGPVELAEWSGGYGFHVALDALSRKFMGSMLQPVHEYHRSGTSAWDIEGVAHRCKNDGFEPPTDSIEDRFMPICYHVE